MGSGGETDGVSMGETDVGPRRGYLTHSQVEYILLSISGKPELSPLLAVYLSL